MLSQLYYHLSLFLIPLIFFTFAKRSVSFLIDTVFLKIFVLMIFCQTKHDNINYYWDQNKIYTYCFSDLTNETINHVAFDFQLRIKWEGNSSLFNNKKEFSRIVYIFLTYCILCIIYILNKILLCWWSMCVLYNPP